MVDQWKSESYGCFILVIFRILSQLLEGGWRKVHGEDECDSETWAVSFWKGWKGTQ